MLFGLSGISVAAIPGEDKGIDLSAVFPNGTTVTYKDVVQYLLLHSDSHSFLAALPNSYM